MPNHCWNTLTIIGHNEDLEEIRKNNISFNYYCPPPEELTDEEKYYWRWSNWGTKWEAYEMCMKIEDEKDENIFECKFTTAWSPPIKFLECLLKRYPRCWLKLLWKTEDDVAGVFVQYYKFGEPVTTNVNWMEAVPILTTDGRIYVPDEIME
jgi:hypothetical protein